MLETPNQNRMWRRFVDIVWQRDFEYAEFQGAVISMVWSLWLLNPWVDVFSMYAGYRSMARLATDHMWGAVLLALGGVQLFGLAAGNYQVRRSGAFFSAAFWMFVFILLVRSSPFFSMAPAALVFFLGSAWGYVRIGRLPRQENNHQC